MAQAVTSSLDAWQILTGDTGVTKCDSSPNKISYAGGTIGLFLGASFVSFIEIVFWIYRVREGDTLF